MLERKLYKTKLCILYERGHCSRQSCSFAHGDAELRRFSHSSSLNDGNAEFVARRNSTMVVEEPPKSNRKRLRLETTRAMFVGLEYCEALMDAPLDYNYFWEKVQ